MSDQPVKNPWIEALLDSLPSKRHANLLRFCLKAGEGQEEPSKGYQKYYQEQVADIIKRILDIAERHKE